MKRALVCAFIFFLGLCGFTAQADTRYVPSQYSTIQSAINDCTDGDTVIVSDGTYRGFGNRDIDFMGKAITVQSTDPNDPCVVDSTIIDCNGTEAEPHRGFYFHNSENTTSVLNGLTIINGYAPNNPYQEGSHTYNHWAGGAIFCYESSPTISNCRLINNYASWYGGALSGRGSNAIITGCFIANNSAPHCGGGIYGEEGMIITNCIITGNTALGGGGIGCRGGGSIINNCLITGNIALRGGGIGTVGSMGVGGARPKIINCTFSGNKASAGGAIYCAESSYPFIINSILWGDIAINGSGIAMNNEIAMNTIDWGSSLSISYSDVQGGKAGILWKCRLNWGIGNIDTDPCFGDLGAGDYHLLEDSPCIDSGDPNYVAESNETDLDGKPRVIGGWIDMGAYEFNHQPIADAGSDQTVYAWIDGIAEVTLDGNGSYDDDGDELTYLWTWAIDSNNYDANGINPSIELPVGQYVISLIVNDGIVDSEPNEVVITVIGPIEANLNITPKVLNCKSFLPKIMAMMRLPKGITKDQIDTQQPLLLYPGAIKADWKWIGRDYDYKCRAWRTTIFAWFDKDDLMSAIDGKGKVELAVVGQLKTGQYFFSSDTVTVICPGRWPWHRHWFDHRWNRWCRRPF